ncbi:sugar phosphate isomerase/epimerase family protein [Streptomyces sp. NPDC094448]|uniref:sugar phosphate isomerase/epimerase family protein n=1 Tax=Streptomyces sp. NPDC094448 TaxID=3366063 RepID=UPI00381CF7FC
MPVREVAALAADTGYQGVELRAHPEEPVHPGIGPGARAAALGEFRRAGVAVLSVCGYARVAAAGPDTPVLDEIAELVELARDLRAPYVRVFPGGAPSDGDADAVAARRLAAAVGPAERVGVRLLLETHDSHRTGRSVARVLSRTGRSQRVPEAPPPGPSPDPYRGPSPGPSRRPPREPSRGLSPDPNPGTHPDPHPDPHPGTHAGLLTRSGGGGGGGPHPAPEQAARAAAGAVWDVLHTWLGGEAPAATREALSPFLGYVQVKDVASREDPAPLPLGAGVLPLAEVLSELSRPMWLSWEYEKRWAPEAVPLPELLVPGREYLERLLGTGR